MALAQSKVTAQGQISVPAEIRRRLGIVPGSILEWDIESGEGRDKIVVRRKGKFTFEDIRRALYPNGPPKRRSLAEMKQGIRQYILERHGRR